MLKQNLLAAIKAVKANSTWTKAVKQDALDLLENVVDNNIDNINLLKKALLNGADNWYQYSHCGFALCYNKAIAEHYCTSSELKRANYGQSQPNSRESWLDLQARALYQACNLIVENFIAA